MLLAFFNKSEEKIYEILDTNNLTLDNIRGIGIGMPSYVLFEDGKIIMTSTLPTYRSSLQKNICRKNYAKMVRIIIDNDGLSEFVVLLGKFEYIF